MGSHRNVGGQDTVAGLSCCLLPTTTAYTLDSFVWVSSSYVHANKVNEIHNTVLICIRIGGFGKVDMIT